MSSDDTFTAEVPNEIVEDEDYTKWESKSADGSQLTRIEAAREVIEKHGLVTNAKDLKDGLYEKKWKKGLRLYFAVIEQEDGKKTVLLLGSGKDRDQDQAIAKAKKSLKKYKVVAGNIKYKT